MGLRLLAVVLLGAWDHPNAIEHELIATNLVEGRGFAFNHFGYSGPSSVQSPTYPFFLAGLFLLFGTSSPGAYAVALAVNCLIGALAVAGAARLALAVGGSRAHALVAAALLAVWPTQIYAATHAQAVPLIVACTAWMMALFLEATRNGALRPWLGYSGCAVLASLTEPSLLPITALSGLLILAWRPLPGRVRLRNAAILLAAAVVMIGPWTLRNWVVHGRLMPVKSSFWVNVWKGANDHASGTDRIALPEADDTLDSLQLATLPADHAHQYDLLTPAQLAELTGKNEVEREVVFGRWAREWIRENPGRYLDLCLLRLQKSLWIDWDNPKARNVVYVASRAALLLLSLPGLGLAVARRWRLGFPLLVFASVLALNTLVLTAARFAFPFEPFQLVLGSATLVWLADLVRPGASPRGGKRFAAG